MKKQVCVAGAVAVLALFFLAASIALLVAHVMEDAVDARVKEEVILKNGTDSFQSWENPPPPIYIQFYFFNVTNPLEVLQGAIPILREIGPYTYREHKPRVDVHFLYNGTEVSSLNPTTYYFVPEKSVGDPEVDRIRTVNVPAVTAMNMATGTPLHLPLQLMLMYYEETMFVTHTVHEWLWGYKDRFLSAAHKLRPSIDPEFGFFYKMNGTDDGKYVMWSGKNDYMNFSRIVTWNGKKSVDWWATPYANMINGTDGTSFHPLINPDETLYAFVSDFCRSIYITFEQYVTVRGIPAYRFTPPPKFFANVSVNPDNIGFCAPGGRCVGSGLLNVTSCRQGAPIFLSPPHFYQCDEKYSKAVDGMHPNKENDETYLDINPMTGVLVRAARRIQINVHVRKLPEFILTGNIRESAFPVFYLNESVVIDKASADKLKMALFESSVVTSIPYVVMTIGIIFGVLFVVFACRPFRTREESSEDERAPLIRTS